MAVNYSTTIVDIKDDRVMAVNYSTTLLMYIMYFMYVYMYITCT